MSSLFNSAPFSQFSRVQGQFGTLAPFLYQNSLQESITGDGDISVNCFNTKIYTTDNSFTLNLFDGKQDGTLKKITLVFKGNEYTTVTVNCPSLPLNYSRIVFTNIGDQALLLWLGGSWSVLETINIIDPPSQTPVIE